MESDSDEPGGEDDDEYGDTGDALLDEVRSDASSDIIEVDGPEFPSYFRERSGRLFHSHGTSPYPLPVDASEQHVRPFFFTVLVLVLVAVVVVLCLSSLCLCLM